MGSWAPAAWDNDGAADWFGDLFDSTGLANHVRETLQRDVAEYHQEIRAAAYVVAALGLVYIWPIAHLDRDLALAIQKLEEIKSLDNYQGYPEYIQAINEEISVLKSRLKKPDA